jgi:hypothetical protein
MDTILVKIKTDRKAYQREYYKHRYNTDPEFKKRHIANLAKSRLKYKQLKIDLNK